MRQSSSFKTVLIATMGAIMLAACGGGENTFTPPPTSTVPPNPPPPPPPPPPPSQSLQEQAGAGFATAFNQAPTDAPVEPVAGDIIPLDKTADPLEVPDP